MTQQKFNSSNKASYKKEKAPVETGAGIIMHMRKNLRLTISRSYPVLFIIRACFKTAWLLAIGFDKTIRERNDSLLAIKIISVFTYNFILKRNLLLIELSFGITINV